MAAIPPHPASMVVRGGYGVYYNTSVYQAIATNMAQQPPLSKSFSVPNSPADPLTLANGFNAVPTATSNTFAIDPNFRVGYAQGRLAAFRAAGFAKGATNDRDLRGHQRNTRATQEFLPNTYPVGGASPCLAGCPAGFLYMTSNGNSTRESGQLQFAPAIPGMPGLPPASSTRSRNRLTRPRWAAGARLVQVIAQNWH